ncbi:hypothetical protein DIPPA_03996 [Diplonema papillatum]|nr:hypothetical protein DIPPA_03996 [Diplonema papillatum]
MRRTIVLLGSGGGIQSGGAGKSWGAKPREGRSWHTPRAFLNRYGGMYTKSHKPGTMRDRMPPYMVRNTMAYHQTEPPEYTYFDFVERNDLVADRKQLVAEEHFVPEQNKKMYEAWKIENKETVARDHAGKYVVATWKIDGKTGTGGEGGIVAGYTPAEFATVHVELDFNTWIDYIPKGFGQATPTEDDLRKAEWFNDTDFDDMDGIKDWLNFSDRPSWHHTRATTPVSRNLLKPAATGDEAAASCERERIPMPAVKKFLTFNTYFGYGSEQFSPWFMNRPEGVSHVEDHAFFQPKMEYARLGYARQIVSETLYMRDPKKRRSHKQFTFMRELDRDLCTISKVDPAGKELWLVPPSRLAYYTSRRFNIRTKLQQLKNIGDFASISTSMNTNPNGPRYGGKKVQRLAARPLKVQIH